MTNTNQQSRDRVWYYCLIVSQLTLMALTATAAQDTNITTAAAAFGMLAFNVLLIAGVADTEPFEEVTLDA